jgi:ABC-type glycerol-3-phosphate transport system substrate-binding protein
MVVIIAVPVAEVGEKSTNVLGATNLYVNATTRSADASWALIRYFTAPEQQKFRSLEGARIPVLKSSYEDQELLRKAPIMALGKQALQTVRPRPVSPYYSDMSLAMAEQFNTILQRRPPHRKGQRPFRVTWRRLSSRARTCRPHTAFAMEKVCLFGGCAGQRARA